MIYYFIILFALIVFIIWNRYNFKSLINKNANDQKLNDSRYYELKNKQDFIMALGSVILFIVGFLGFQSIKEVKSDIINSMKKNLDSVNIQLKQARNSVTLFSNELQTYKKDFSFLEQSTGLATSKVRNT